MAIKLECKPVAGISSRALFDLEAENYVYKTRDLGIYTQYQCEHGNNILLPGTAFPHGKILHRLNAGGHDYGSNMSGV